MGNVVQLNRPASVQSVTIASGGTTSGVITLEGFAMGMVMLPSTFDGTTVTFTVCDTYGGTYVPYTGTDGNAVSITTAASKAFALPEGLFAAKYIKMVGGSTQTTTDTVFTVMLKG